MNPPPDIDAAMLPEIAMIDGSLADRVHTVVKEAILSLDFPPGAIVRKGAICDRLGVSRAPVSEALARLSTDGLVDVVPQSATRVSFFSLDEIREGAFLREALELATLAKVAAELGDDQRKILSRNMRLQELLIDDDDVEGFYQADEEFHQLLMSFTGFQRLSAVAQTVSLQVTRARRLLLPTPGRIAETLREHRAIFDAVLDRDADAAQAAMRHHLGQMTPRIERLLAERPELVSLAAADAEETG